MTVKALLALALASVPVPVAPASFIADAAIPKVVCPVLGGYSVGSAFRIGPGLLLSVKHVTGFSTCLINNRPITVRYASPTLDFSMIADSGIGPSLKVDCGGFVRGRKYLAVGHARGLDQLTTVELEATGQVINGFYALKGIFTVVPGQSGGAVVDKETGAVVGTINVYDAPRGLSGSVELKDTPICRS